MPDPVVVPNPTLQEAAKAGAGPAANPWEAYGLNPDGTPIEVKKVEVPADPEKAALQAKLATIEAALAKLPEGFEALSKKVSMVDKLVAAIRGDEPEAPANFREVWSDLKKVANTQAPGVAKLLAMLEEDPQYLERLEGANQALMASHVIGINQKAHERVLDLAKKAGFKAGTDEEFNEMVFPFEQSMTMMINANPEMRRAFLSGNVQVVDDVFNRMIKPHVAQRLRAKQDRLAPLATPKAPPKGAGSPGVGNEETTKRNLATPQGRANFHQQAVARWINKVSSKGDDT